MRKARNPATRTCKRAISSSFRMRVLSFTSFPGHLSDEDKWRAQFGQVIDQGRRWFQSFDWWTCGIGKWLEGCTEDRKYEVARFVGRLVKQPAKHRPSMPSRGGKSRSAPIYETHLDPFQLEYPERRNSNVYAAKSALSIQNEIGLLKEVYCMVALVWIQEKNPIGGDNDTLSSPVGSCPQEAAAEVLNISFGAGSCARKKLKSMGWKELEGLGNSI